VDGAAAERVLGRQVVEDSRASVVRHGVIDRRMPDQADQLKK
jgi:hypothetical protein